MLPITRAFYAIFLKPALQLYLRLEPVITVSGMRIKVPRSVFHPRLYFSSGYMLQFLGGLPLKDRSVLDVGCGSGVLALAAASMGADAVGVDINPAAVSAARENAVANGLASRVTVIESDVFSNLEPRVFDYIIVNPPYYFRKPDSHAARAWYCGSDGEFFRGFFSALKQYVAPRSGVYMCLEEKCEITKISDMARSFGYVMELTDRKKMKWEVTYIFRIIPESLAPLSAA